MSRWYVEELAFDGRFKPAIYEGRRPDEKTVEGRRRTFRKVVEMSPSYKNLTLGQAEQIYGTNASFRSQADHD